MKNILYNILKKIFFIIASCFLLANTAESINLTTDFDPHFFKGIVIQTVSIGSNNYEVVIQQTFSKDNSLQKKIKDESNDTPELGKVLWTITGNQLSINQEDCLEYDASFCPDYNRDKDPGWPTCYSMCLLGGPEFLAYDEKTRKVYISSQIGLGWNHYWPTIIYSADLETKKINKLTLDGGPVDASLSSLGDYLILSGNHLSIINTTTGENLHPNDKAKLITPKDGPLVYTYYKNIKWIDNHTIQYEVVEFTDKFSDKTDVISKHQFNIKTKVTKNFIGE